MGGGATLQFGSPRARTAFAISVRARRDAVREWVRPRARTGDPRARTVRERVALALGDQHIYAERPSNE